jgi:hypothetical protein
VLLTYKIISDIILKDIVRLHFKAIDCRTEDIQCLVLCNRNKPSYFCTSFWHFARDESRGVTKSFAAFTAMSATNQSVFVSQVFVPKSLRAEGSNMMSLGSALAEALGESNPSTGTRSTASKPVEEKRAWSSSQDREIRWEHSLFGSLQIQIDQFSIGKVKEESTNSWAQVYFLFDKPSRVLFRFQGALAQGVRLFRVQGAQVTEVTTGKIPCLQVGIQWGVDGNKDVARTSSTERDSINFVFLAGDGKFVEIQVSLTSRCKRFWLGVQEVYCGQVVRTTSAKADQIELTNIRRVPIQVLTTSRHSGLVVRWWSNTRSIRVLRFLCRNVRPPRGGRKTDSCPRSWVRMGMSGGWLSSLISSLVGGSSILRMEHSAMCTSKTSWTLVGSRWVRTGSFPLSHPCRLLL